MRYLLHFWMLLLLTGCKNKEDEPQFKTVYQLQLSGTAKKTTKMKGAFAFHNPAEKSVWTFVSLMSDISVEGKDVGTYVYTDNVPIKSGSEFKVPLLYNIDTDKLPVKEEISVQSVAIRLKGHVLLVSEKGDKLKVPFDHTETVKASIQRENNKDKRQDRKEEKNLRKELRKQQKEQLKLEKSNQ